MIILMYFYSVIKYLFIKAYKKTMTQITTIEERANISVHGANSTIFF